jgi:hypothetical protein
MQKAADRLLSAEVIPFHQDASAWYNAKKWKGCKRVNWFIS